MSFSIGYIAGPFSVVFLGHIGDRKGRRFTMIVSLLLMGISTSIIGILPPAQTARAWTAIALQLMRLVQCFGRGGTWGGSILIAFENVTESKRSFYAAIPQILEPVTVHGGLFLRPENNASSPHLQPIKRSECEEYLLFPCGLSRLTVGAICIPWR